MPPKIKITKEEIVDTALNLVREAGVPHPRAFRFC